MELCGAARAGTACRAGLRRRHVLRRRRACVDGGSLPLRAPSPFPLRADSPADPFATVNWPFSFPTLLSANEICRSIIVKSGTATRAQCHRCGPVDLTYSTIHETQSLRPSPPRRWAAPRAHAAAAAPATHDVLLPCHGAPPRQAERADGVLQRATHRRRRPPLRRREGGAAVRLGGARGARVRVGDAGDVAGEVARGVRGGHDGLSVHTKVDEWVAELPR